MPSITLVAGDSYQLINDIRFADADIHHVLGPVTIRLGNDVSYGLGNTSGPLPEITAGTHLTIVGNGATIARDAGASPFRLFKVDSGAFLTLQDLTLRGGEAYGTGAAAEGGAVYSSGTLALSHVTAVYNTAQGRNGTNGVGSASAGTGANAFGGGLYVAGGSVTLTNDAFEANVAVGGGGSGNFVGGNGGVGYGGGLYVAGGTVTLTQDNFSNNYAKGGDGGRGGSGWNSDGGKGGKGGAGLGGGLYVAGGAVTLNGGSNFAGNTAQGGSGGSGGNSYLGSGGNGGDGGAAFGGGLFVAEATATLNNDILSGNVAQGGSGGIGGSVVQNPYGGTRGNGGDGGAGYGGGLLVAGITVTLSNDIFHSNIAQGGSGGTGGTFGKIGPNVGNGGNGGAGYGGGLFAAADGVTLIGKNTLSENFAVGGSGGTGGYFELKGTRYYYGNGGNGGAAIGGGLFTSDGHTVLGNGLTFITNNGSQAGSGGFGTMNGPFGTATFPDIAANSPGYGNYVVKQPINVSSDLSLTGGGLFYNYLRREFVQTITITNTSDSTLYGPLALVLTNLPSTILSSDGQVIDNHVILVNASGTYDGDPYLDLVSPFGALAAGQSITVTLYFRESVFWPITYKTQVWQNLS